jgi:hypothetical protein
MVIACQDFGDAQRTDAATLPPFSNHSACGACGNARGIRVHYSPGSRDIAGPHFRRICSACGAQWAKALLPQAKSRRRPLHLRKRRDEQLERIGFLSPRQYLERIVREALEQRTAYVTERAGEPKVVPLRVTK